MKKTMTLLLLSLLLAGVQTAGAQEQDVVTSVRQRYAAVKERIGLMMGEDAIPQEYYQVRVLQNLPGTGPHEEDVRMYYGYRDDHDIWPSRLLEFVSTRYNYAARVFYEEYLYAPNGSISFIYATLPDFMLDKELEFRFYFEDGLVQMVVKSRKAGDSGAFTPVYSGDTLPDEYREYYDSYMESSRKFHQLFNSVDMLAH